MFEYVLVSDVMVGALGGAESVHVCLLWFYILINLIFNVYCPECRVLSTQLSNCTPGWKFRTIDINLHCTRETKIIVCLTLGLIKFYIST